MGELWACRPATPSQRWAHQLRQGHVPKGSESLAVPQCDKLTLVVQPRSPLLIFHVGALASLLSSCFVEVPDLASVSDAGKDAPIPDADAQSSDASDSAHADETPDSPKDTDLDHAEDVVEADTGCAPGTEDCDGDLSNGCEDLASDPLHCGVCGHDCLGGACLDGTCQPVVLATEVGEVYAMAKDGDFIYGTSSSGGSVWKVPVAGCAIPSNCAQILSTPGTNYRDLAVNEDAVFFTDSSAGRVVRVNKDGSAQCGLVSDSTAPWGIVASTSQVYWCVSGGASIRVVSTACGGTNSSLLVPTVAPHHIAMDESGLYWTKKTGGLVSWASKDGSSTEPVWSGSTPGGYMFAPVLDDAWVYWREGKENPIGGTARVVRANKDRSGVLEVIAPDQPTPRFMAVDGTHAYWTTTESVRRTLKDGSGEVETVATGLSGPHAIVVDDLAVYVGASWGASVFKVAKP